MNRKLLSFLSILIIAGFIGYMIYDTSRKEKPVAAEQKMINPVTHDAGLWEISEVLPVPSGTLKAVAVSRSGNIYLGGNSFISCYDSLLEVIWNVVTSSAVTSLSVYGDTVYATTFEQVLVLNKNGEMINEWGPYDEGSILTSVSAGKSSVVIADAGNSLVYVLDKGGEVKKMIGQLAPEFVIPSAYFDVEINDDQSLFVANTGMRRIERRTPDGMVESWFGEAGTAPGAFCGCCNPAHFTVIPGGFVTAEKGLNRIKILDNKGDFVEFVSAQNDFEPSLPLDVASTDGKVIYAANTADSKLYIFKRKE